ncbi:MAG TPA: type II secretion system protein [Rhabdochlamydiaceae bacterium]|nr:type II secretion system protein [Rhabdochlamydiaceae bacterium]
MKKEKRPLTLLEIMIVIFLIGLIGSVIGYNMKGSLDEGKAFKTEQGMAQIRDILLLEVAKGTPREKVIDQAQFYLKKSGLVKDAAKMMKDGWGDKFNIAESGTADIKVTSEKYHKFKQNKNKKPDGGIEQIEPEENEDWEAS